MAAQSTHGSHRFTDATHVGLFDEQRAVRSSRRAIDDGGQAVHTGFAASAGLTPRSVRRTQPRAAATPPAAGSGRDASSAPCGGVWTVHP
jgi:hypothetical protein